MKNYKVYDENMYKPDTGCHYFHGYIKTYNKIFTDDLEFKILFKSGNSESFSRKWPKEKKASEDISKRIQEKIKSRDKSPMIT